VHLVPAFVGLGAPHWRSDVRAAITGLTLDSGPAHFARAALEAAAFQTGDLLDAMAADGMAAPSLMRIDGGMASNDWFAQCLSLTSSACRSSARDIMKAPPLVPPCSAG
jgi:glycerol kinase